MISNNTRSESNLQDEPIINHISILYIVMEITIGFDSKIILIKKILYIYMNNFIILPNQLFDKKYLNKDNKYIIYGTSTIFHKYNLIKKLILHRASMKYYFNYLKK